MTGINPNQYQAQGIVIDNFNADSLKSRSNAIKRLLIEYHNYNKADNNTSLKKLIDQFNFQDKIAGKINHLDKKLDNEGCKNDITWDLKIKQDYYKKLQRTKFYTITQSKHTYILVRTYLLFIQHVYGRMENGATKKVIKRLIIEKVINGIAELITVEKNALALYIEDINAMVSFLVGSYYSK